MTFEQIYTDLKNKIYKPLYLFYGDESFYIDFLTDYMTGNILKEEEKDFNLSVFYGLNTTGSSIVDRARRYPTMADYNLVIVREAQQLRSELGQLSQYALHPSSSTILTVALKLQSSRKHELLKDFKKAVDKFGVSFESKKLYDDKIPQWIRKYLSARGYTITDHACQMMADDLGNDLSLIVNECAKLIINLPKGSNITPEIIEKYIGISKDFNPFELCRTISQRNKFGTAQIVLYFASNPKENPPIKISTVLFNYFQKLWIYHQLNDKKASVAAPILGVNPFFVKEYAAAARNFYLPQCSQVLQLISEYDLKFKGVDIDQADPVEMMKEMIYKILSV